MKDAILIALCCCLGAVAWSGSATNAMGRQKTFDDLYDQWHKTLAANPGGGEPSWISTPEMKQAGIAFAIHHKDS